MANVIGENTIKANIVGGGTPISANIISNNNVINANPITYNYATTTKAGIIRIATDEEASQGVLRDVVITPYTLLVGLNSKQDIISDLPTIRNNANKGANAYSTISNYGNIVTHNTSEFATSSQGILADNALQPNDNITELNNDAGYVTESDLPTKLSDLTDDLGSNPIHTHSQYLTSQDISGKADIADLSEVAFSGDYTDLSNLPTIGNAEIEIQKNNTKIDSFTTNQSGNKKTINIPVPTKLSELNNDTGFISSVSWNDVNNKPATFTPSYHEHVSSEITDLSTTIASAISGKADIATSLSGYGITDAYTKAEIDGMVSAGMHYKGTKSSVSALPSTGNQIGDLWNVEDTGANYAWNGTSWDKLSENIDLSGYVPTSRTINGKALSGDISLNASDVGALPSSTVIPTVNNSTITIQKNGTNVQSFTLNQSNGATINITVPTDTNDLTNGAGFITSADLPTVDQTFDETSTNAQSGVAVNDALTNGTINPIFNDTLEFSTDANIFAPTVDIQTDYGMSNQLTVNGNLVLTQFNDFADSGTFQVNSNHMSVYDENGLALFDFMRDYSIIKAFNSTQNKTNQFEIYPNAFAFTNDNGSATLTVTSNNKLAMNGEELATLNDIPTTTNFVTTDTAQNITGTKTFVGQKKIAFKQSGTSDKLGFTLYNNSNVEKGYLEYNPSNQVDSVPLMTLGNYATASAGLTHVGFRKYSSISGASGAYNLLTPLISDAKTPFNLTTTYTNFYLPLGFTDGTNTVMTAKTGMVNISSLLPTPDQVYDGTSANAQSGVAIAGKLTNGVFFTKPIQPVYYAWYNSSYNHGGIIYTNTATPTTSSKLYYYSYSSHNPKIIDDDTISIVSLVGDTLTTTSDTFGTVIFTRSSANDFYVVNTVDTNGNEIKLNYINDDDLDEALSTKQDTLGYTPVNKSGDTMSGMLTIDKANSTLLNLKGSATTILGVYSNFDYSTATSSGTCHNDVTFYDYTNTRRNTIRSHYSYDNTGTLTQSKIVIGTNKFDGSAPQGLEVGYNGTSGYIVSNFTPSATNSTSSNNVPTCGWVNDATKSTNVVHRTNSETIAGAKTFTDDMTINKSNPNFIVKDSRIDFTTNPSSNIFSVFSALKDANNVSVGEVWHEYKTDGSHSIYLQSRKSATDNTTYSILKAGWDANGNAYSSFPNTTCVDGQWVASVSTLASGVNLPTTDNLSYDISSYLPADANTYQYEVMLTGVIYTGATNGNQSILRVGGEVNGIVCQAIARSNASYRAAGTITVATPASHSNIIRVFADSGNTGTFNLSVRGYRRIGTNT